MMRNSREFFKALLEQLPPQDDAGEAQSIAYLVLEHVAGITRTDILANRQQEVTEAMMTRLAAVVQKLGVGEPVQYILGEADFYGHRFRVTPAVLIPRPETELLIDIIKTFYQQHHQQHPTLRLLDIGTGSGCIAIATALECGGEIHATDVSVAALDVARDNAARLNARVSFNEHDILLEALDFAGLDVVVSNPPYIALSEKADMRHNVVGFEPHGALFVPDDDALVFYRAIAVKAHDVLRAGGMLCVEINERFGPAVRDLFERMGYGHAQVIRDLSGKDRIVSAFKLN